MRKTKELLSCNSFTTPAGKSSSAGFTRLKMGGLAGYELVACLSWWLVKPRQARSSSELVNQLNHVKLGACLVNQLNHVKLGACLVNQLNHVKIGACLFNQLNHVKIGACLFNQLNHVKLVSHSKRPDSTSQ